MQISTQLLHLNISNTVGKRELPSQNEITSSSTTKDSKDHVLWVNTTLKKDREN